MREREKVINMYSFIVEAYCTRSFLAQVQSQLFTFQLGIKTSYQILDRQNQLQKS